MAAKKKMTLPVPGSAFNRPMEGGRMLGTAPLRSAHPLAVLGLTWRSADAARLELRTRRRGRWSEWVALPSATEHGPPSRRGVHASEAAAVGHARVFQLRAARPPAGLRAHGVAVNAATVTAANATAAPSSAAAPAIVPRSDWGAEAPRSAPEYGEVQLAFVHHTVSTNDYGPEDSAAIVRGIQHYHRNVLGWNDIGYQLLVDRHGQVFEGRGGGVDKAIVGAQAQGYNAVSTGVAVIGTHTSDGVGAAAFEALASVLAWKLSLHGVPTQGEVTVTSAGGSENRFPADQSVTLERISGHRDGGTTACPGEALYDQLPALRARAARLATPAGLSMAVSPGRVGQLEPATASGRLLRPDGTPGAGIRVEVQARAASGWEAVASGVTDGAGFWAADITLPYTRSLRAQAALDAATPPLLSARVRLEVRSVVNATLAPRALHVGRRALLRGTVEPRRRLRRLIVTVERRVGTGPYVRVVRFPALARSGEFRVPLFPSRPGRYRVRVTVRSDRLNAGSRSVFVFARARR